MSLRRKDDEVGYKRPPKSAQWKRGQCGNLKRHYKRRASKGIVELIDAAFAQQIDIVENGASRRISVFEAILLQLSTKEMSGDRRAMAVRLKYQEFVAAQGGPGEVIVEYERQQNLLEPDARDE
ncbi:DUF5681 domain-containing protein [Methylocapsa acidiphila]|uniref:DUF5681 domain-containing protein n=1 Tax=Methylocapsa acidiphila TaxID=133552 RepID=UPI00041598BE|nr:DUF5681 domain-containing protein [Methylocapsa acidiphila]